jgi:hypothetical protein
MENNMNLQESIRNDLNKINEDKTTGDYVFIWHNGSYEPEVRIVNYNELDDLITEDMGYDEEDKNDISVLKPGQSWVAVDGGHTIIAI